MNTSLSLTLTPALALTASLALAHGVPEAPEPMNLEQLVAATGWDFDAAEIRTEQVADGLHVLFGLGGNIAVSTGDDGVFIVDDQFPQIMPQINAAIGELGGERVDFAVTTHWHFDHAEGNLALGPAGTWLVAHENSREMMQSDRLINMVAATYEQKAYPESAWPDITFSDDMRFHINGQQIDLLHFGPAHTTGDTAVIFRSDNAIHMGDVFNNAGYPFIDADNGGTLDGVIHFCSEILKVIDEDTIVIPGHGAITDYQALNDYVDMLTVIRERLVALIKAGKSLDEVYAENPTAEYDKAVGDSTGFINRAFVSLTHRYYP